MFRGRGRRYRGRNVVNDGSENVFNTILLGKSKTALDRNPGTYVESAYAIG